MKDQALKAGLLFLGICLVMILILIWLNSCTPNPEDNNQAKLDTTLVIMEFARSGDVIFWADTSTYIAAIDTFPGGQVIRARRNYKLAVRAKIDTLSEAEYEKMWIERKWGATNEY